MNKFFCIAIIIAIFSIERTEQLSSDSCIVQNHVVCELKNSSLACCPIKDGICCESGDFCCPKSNEDF